MASSNYCNYDEENIKCSSQEDIMRTTITLNDDLLKMSQPGTHAPTAPGAVNEALTDWARRLRVDRIKAMAGKVRFEGDLGELRRLELKKAEKLNARRPR